MAAWFSFECHVDHQPKLKQFQTNGIWKKEAVIWTVELGPNSLNHTRVHGEEPLEEI